MRELRKRASPAPRTRSNVLTTVQMGPSKRAKLRGLKRNAAVVLGTVGTPDAADVLTQALDDPEPLVREHAAWALERIHARAPHPE